MARFFVVIGLFLGCAGVARSQPVHKQDSWLDTLRNDPRLKAPVNLRFKTRPSAREVFVGLEEATGLTFGLGSGADNDVVFGTMTVINVPAWKVMEQLATSQIVDGRWQSTEKGYILVGRPKEFPSAETKNQKLQSPGSSWSPITVFAIVGLAIAVILFAVRSLLRRTKPAG